LRNIDRLVLVWLYRVFPSILDAIVIVKPETVLRWHRRGFRAYWRWKSRCRGGRPRIDRELCALMAIRSKLTFAQFSKTNIWVRGHGRLIKVGRVSDAAGQYSPSFRTTLGCAAWTFGPESRESTGPDRAAASLVPSEFLNFNSSKFAGALLHSSDVKPSAECSLRVL